jgi:hypothetical protein
MRLFHFSDDSGIAHFEPRPVRIPVERPGGQDWLNGPLVWAIDEWHSPLYLFPRECPRILIWKTDKTTADDTARWFAGSTARMIAHIETAWLERVATHTLYRYELDTDGFEDIGDVGMWVSRRPATLLHIKALADLPSELVAQNVELRVRDSLLSLKDAWQSSLHASGIRLRNAENWGKPGWPHSNSRR